MRNLWFEDVYGSDVFRLITGNGDAPESNRYKVSVLKTA
jgi:hypothetical protein